MKFLVGMILFFGINQYLWAKTYQTTTVDEQGNYYCSTVQDGTFEVITQKDGPCNVFGANLHLVCETEHGQTFNLYKHTYRIVEYSIYGLGKKFSAVSNHYLSTFAVPEGITLMATKGKYDHLVQQDYVEHQKSLKSKVKSLTVKTDLSYSDELFGKVMEGGVPVQLQAQIEGGRAPAIFDVTCQ
jgi:hypothetical protein